MTPSPGIRCPRQATAAGGVVVAEAVDFRHPPTNRIAPSASSVRQGVKNEDVGMDSEANSGPPWRANAAAEIDARKMSGRRVRQRAASTKRMEKVHYAAISRDYWMVISGFAPRSV
jgi:hypothetical protein